MLSLRSISRAADMHLVKVVKPRAGSFGTEVPQDDAEGGELHYRNSGGDIFANGRIMRRPSLRSLTFIGCVLCLSAITFAQAQGNASRPLTPLEQTLIANTKAIPEAQKSKNVDFLKRTLTDDFVFVGSEGRLHDKEEFVESARDGELKDYYTYNLRVLPVNDEAALVTYDSVIHMPEGDAPGMAPRYQHISDLWVKQDDQWRLKFQQATPARPID
jgi:hypothetical protein